MKKIKYIVLMLVFFNLTVINSYGQFVEDTENPTPKIVPPSPEANALGKFGEIPVGLYSGSAQYDLTLYTVKGKNLSVPIKLNYSTNGIMIEDISSWVGTDWSLTAGGVITRTVRGEPDEIHVLENIPELNSFCLLYDEVRLFENSDVEYDVYNYNFLGHSGSFIIKNNEVKLIEKSELKFDTVLNSLNKFIITDGNGVKYYFGEATIGDDAIEFSQVDTGAESKTAWYLTKIEHWTGEQMLFEYEVDETYYSYDSNFSQTMTLGIDEVQQHPDCISSELFFPILDCNNSTFSSLNTITSNTVRHNTAYLKKIINYNNSDNVEIFATNRNIGTGVGGVDRLKKIFQIVSPINKIRFDITEATWYRMYLNAVEFLSISDQVNEVYRFEYNKTEDNWTPDRFGKYRDYWGYYNGVTSNTSLVLGNHQANSNANITGYGVLKKIIFPTKGYSEIEYEPNSSTKKGGLFSSCSDVTSGWVQGAQIYGNNEPGYLQDFPLNLSFHQEINIEFLGEYFPDPNPAINGLTTGHAKLTVYNVQTFEIYAEESIYGNQNKTISLNLPPGNYKISLSVKSHIYHVRFSYNLCNSYSNDANIVTITGGIRVKQVKSFSKDSELSSTKTYEYSEEQVASPIKTRFSYNVTDFNPTVDTAGYDALFDNITAPIYPYCVFMTRLSNPLFTNNHSSLKCFYGKVTEKVVNGNIVNSEITHKFKSSNFSFNTMKVFNHTDEYSHGKYGNTQPSYFVSGSPYEYQTLEYSNNGSVKQLVRETKFNYGFENDTKEFYKSFLVDKVTRLRQPMAGSTFNVGDLECVLSEKLSLQMNVWVYYHVSSLRTLNSKVETQYFYNSSDELILPADTKKIVTTTNFYYENPLHKQVTKIETDTSEKISTALNETKKETIKYFYPSDFSPSSTFVPNYFGNVLSGVEINNLLQLVSQNRITTPFQIEKFTTNNGLNSVVRTVYKDWEIANFSGSIEHRILPEKVMTLRPDNNDLVDKINFKKYSIYGDLLEKQETNGINTCYVYGYRGMYLIGVLENINYADLSPYNSTINSFNSTDSEAGFNAFFNTLRDNFSSVMVTNYFYYPLVGIKSVVDPKRYKKSYLYDNFNRLIKVMIEDKDYILKEFDYNYKN